jgi:hypothetical protein
MNYLHYDFEAPVGSIIEVTLDKQANVRLLDSINYSNYKTGRRFQFTGGKALRSPIKLEVPHAGHWHVVIDLGGYRGTIRASARLIR